MRLGLLGKDCHRLAFPAMKDGRPTLENYALFKSSGSDDVLSNTAMDFLQSSVQELADRPKEVLKQAILYHEIMFRKQVLELHRLYQTQKNLMHDLSWRDFDKHLGSRDSQITNQSTEMDLLMADSPVVNSTMGESGSIFQECLIHTPQITFKLELSVEDPIKSADTEFLGTQNSFYYISDSEELELTLGNKKQRKNERSGVGKLSYGKESLISTKGVILAESAEFVSKEDAHSISSFGCQIHVTDSAGKPSAHMPAISSIPFPGRTMKEAIHTSSVCIPNFDHSPRLQEKSSVHLDLGWHPFRGCFSSCRCTQQPGPTSNSPRSLDLNKTFEDFSEISQNLVNLPSSTSSSTTPGILSGQHINAVATPTSLVELSGKSSEETSDVLQATGRNSAPMNSGAKEAEFLTCGYGSHQYCKHASVGRMELDGCARTCSQDEDNPVTTGHDSESIADLQGKSKEGISSSLPGNDLTSANVSPSLSHGLYQFNNEGAEKSLVFPGCCRQNERRSMSTTSMASEKDCNSHPSIWSSNLAQKASAYSEIKQSSGEKSEEDTVSSSPCGNLTSVKGDIFLPWVEIRDEHNGSDPTGEKPDHAHRKKTCSGRNAEVEEHSVHSMDNCSQPSKIGLVVTEKYSGKLEVVAEADDHITLDEKLCNYSESSDNYLVNKGNHEAEVNCPIWRAAESLIHISLQNKTSPLDKIANIGQLEMENEEVSEEPQNSFDSFELMVLTLTENVNDEYSNLARLCKEEIENYNCRFKLRNGRGVRDFRREILPGLVSLSRQEICEDLRTIAEAVRLDELSYGSKKFSKGALSTPVRSRRLRHRYVGKRL